VIKAVIFLGRAFHPRACGGQQAVEVAPTAWRRFIPAPAGPARSARLPAMRCTVHPRACGAIGTVKWFDQVRGGPSPRLRGQLGQRRQQRDQLRFIPAPAEPAAAPSHRASSWPVHPRACGSSCSAITPGVSMAGSSPRLRVQRWLHPAVHAQQRSIPAPAGPSLLARD
jgi:hypothetical protein